MSDSNTESSEVALFAFTAYRRRPSEIITIDIPIQMRTQKKPGIPVAAETRRIADIKSRKALTPSWLDGALRAAGVIKQGESL